MGALDLRMARAPYAADAARSRGRVFAEPPSRSRSEFQRDRDRIIHSSAFRRLAHKTQVFVPYEGDHYRTRLTHSLEVGQIARSIARSLGLDDDLAEALALAHDLGHTPFAHAGEDALDALMEPYGGFDHNAQALRIVTRLERRYAGFDGLNLTFESLEGLVKHNGPLLRPDGAPLPVHAKRGLPSAIVEFNAAVDLELSKFASAEAQVAALADDIAYNAHDIDDGLRAGLLDLEQIGGGVEFLAEIKAEIRRLNPDLEPVRVVHELVRRLLTSFIEDAIDESGRRLAASGAASADAVRAMARPVIASSEPMVNVERTIKEFLFENLYRHPRLNRVRTEANEVICNLFHRFMKAPDEMPSNWARAAADFEIGSRGRARAICDYIAGMTDRYAILEHRRLFDEAPDLR
ncbi:deoxyguanosinetriphosphate triphosphohydrolase [Methylocapsa palsarum]|uniref:Deoxyguanosinetriphosphate triphosphohydrolase-like protein n=1 Tax=Methylocapsa palsarum TaxID=1612308 RepID=A0A1I3Y7K8_9HYPH|nr:deoxyguanosinetriphosphate triphosphohydrolase [Methylocapsa palsarum]SFK27753.1 dGTPase [Methylocapsa palsarum]